MSETIIQLPFDVPLLPMKELRAGNLQCFYERGNLRYICFAGAEALRMIYPAVRDERWGTIVPLIENEVIQCRDDAFLVAYTAICQQADIHFKSEIAIAGTINSIVVTMKGEAVSSFKKNRIGLCVHHPIEACTGKEVFVTRPDKSPYTATFPTFVSPHQPFTNVQKMEWAIDDHHCIQLQFEGDVFETEDQRNWTDHSYKTYSTPLEKPFPVLVQKGTSVEQKIVVKFIDKNTESGTGNRPKQNDSADTQPMPLMAYDMTLEEHTRLNDVLADLPFRTVHLTLNLADANWKETFARLEAEIHAHGLSISLTVVFSEAFSQECDELLAALTQIKARIASVLPLQENIPVTPPPLLQHIYPLWKKAFPNVKIGYGTAQFFAELNRNRPPEIAYDFVAFGMHPQVHVEDTRTIIENLQSLPEILASIQQFTNKPVFVSPITFSEYGNDADERLHTSFGAAWVFYCLKNLRHAAMLTFSQFIPQTKERSLQSPLIAILKQVALFQPVSICKLQKDDRVCFENASDDVLTYILSPVFKDAVSKPMPAPNLLLKS